MIGKRLWKKERSPLLLWAPLLQWHLIVIRWMLVWWPGLKHNLLKDKRRLSLRWGLLPPSTRPSTVTPSRPTVSFTSKGPSVPSTFSNAVVPVRFSLVPKIRTYFQKYVSLSEALVEPEYDDSKISEVVKKAYPSGFFYISEDLHKTRKFNEFILVDTKSVEITHIPRRDDLLRIAYSKLKIFKVMNPTYRNQDPYTEKTFSKPFVPQSFFWRDYQMARFNY